ncbi:hypothetical protein ACHAWF_009394 [Thalassiosira exigua]
MSQYVVVAGMSATTPCHPFVDARGAGAGAAANSRLRSPRGGAGSGRRASPGRRPFLLVAIVAGAAPLLLSSLATLRFPSLPASADAPAGASHPVPGGESAPDAANAASTVLLSSVENDGLVWITPNPREARRVGWEDEWMMEWKRRQYSPTQRVGCNSTGDTPYDDDRVCFVPAYVPARLFDSGEEGRPRIPRVLFVSWLERRIGRAMYTSLLSLLHHNPEYELVLFDDDDVDRFVCALEPEFALSAFSKVRAGAMRADVWRLLIVRRYGGVYLDSDLSAIAKLPIQRGDTAVSGVGGWSHLPGKAGGLFEHWAMAFMPRHPFIDEAVKNVKANLEDPAYLLRDDTPEAEVEGSGTMRLTGPAVYQRTLHDALARARCRKAGNSYVPALFEPERHCDDLREFRKVFPVGMRLFREMNLGGALTHKVFHEAKSWTMETDGFQFSYDDVKVRMREEGDPRFCDEDAFEQRASKRERHWEEKVEGNQ